MDDRNPAPVLPQDQLDAPAADGQETVDAPETESDKEFADETTDTADELEDGQDNEIAFSWQASEYVHHHKGKGWYLGLFVVVAVLSVVAGFIHQWLSIGVFVAMGAAIAVYAQKPPRVLTYDLDNHSVTIEGKTYPYKNFRSFGVISDIEWHTIDLEPTQRFMPRLTVLFGDEDFDAIVDHLSIHLPRTDRQPDVIERVTRYLRF